jgi:catechol 2,3-dioxygenase-like lactoylglutathione lyase family enzyme
LQEVAAPKEGLRYGGRLDLELTTAMSNTNQNARPILNSVAAQLFVRDIKASADFYCSKLGFTVDFLYGDPPFYGQVFRDNAKLVLRCVEEPVFAGDIREREGLLSAAITLGSPEEIKQLFLDYQSAGAAFGQALQNEPWGATTFIVRDPDGNLILFAGPAG